mgnify:CR=1 FL=1|tara:strand:+ start:557 stop:1624 length:1068 start_codon:yes stop_codon:yes gene_type:complete
MNNESNSFEHYELISAYHDGEVTEDERAVVESSPELLSEVKKLKKISIETSSLSPIDPVLKEKHLQEALSQLPNNARVIPFRQRRSIQGGVLLAAAAAAVAFLIIPAINSSNDMSDPNDILATGFTEQASVTSEESPVENDQTTERQTGVDTETEASGSQIATEPEPPQIMAEADTAPFQTDNSSVEEAPLGGDEQNQMQVQEDEGEEAEDEAEAEAEAEAEEESAEALSEETTSEETAEIFDPANSLETFLESTSGMWESQSRSFISPLSTEEMNAFIQSSPELSECWSSNTFSEIRNSTPLHIHRTFIGGEMSLIVINESSEQGDSPVISIYQNLSSCPLLFEGPVIDENNSE